MEIDPGYGWGDDISKELEAQLWEIELPKQLERIEKSRKKHHDELRKQIRKLGHTPRR